ncbi:hypothetical protein QQS21_004945 [Conoideocrella luteorostrata]|uniref:TM7S3/TM198-like domain-containing protein n=1 Tax=Conoideocrella luteorostrata TaxID=1105319 RepID=A0AAJ0CRD3_9HYPO|nr:hypothetical protein QQS21_004945 [Conoideocrella luteorostrata]
MILKADRLWALILLVLIVQFAACQGFTVAIRDDGAAPSITAASSPPPSRITDSAGNVKDVKESGAKSDSPESSGSVTAAPSPTKNTTASALPTVTRGGPLDNSTFFNATIPEGQLPLPPQLTPGWGVAGVIMLVTGVIYTLVGIKNRWIHTFFSTAYMTALGVSVLIVYVMNIPLSNALQGGYVVAVVMSGCAVGAAAMFFKELTEGLGCALGGFCVSMWLMCLVPGGLLHTVPSKAIFIASFTLVGFAFYFSRWTRDWALIILMAFGGSTVTVLGIDCFSRAGLKEFWAYVWAINDNLFPLGADTYPVTKGIRVETAAVVIIFLVGIISQIKLWKIVREKREKRAAERAEDQRNLEHEEENVGRQIEESNARERRQWERVYGDGATESVTESRVTDFGDTGSEKRLRRSYIGSKGHTSAEIIEMADMSESDQSRNGPEALMATEDADEGKVTVRVAADDIPESASDAEEETLGERTETRHEGKRFDGIRHSKSITASGRVSRAQTVAEAPEVVPLPFTVPAGADAKSEGDRSSIATFADDAEAPAPTSPRKHQSLVKRLSQGSASLLRNLPQGHGPGSAFEAGDSTEVLVMDQVHRREDDEASLAATVDDASMSGASDHSIVANDEPCDVMGETSNSRRSIEVNAQLGKTGESATRDRTTSRPVSAGNDANFESELPIIETKYSDPSWEPSIELDVPEAFRRPKSVASAVSTPASLTKDRLPRSLSRVAMSYRTNEWAKHLSNAECPEPDELQVAAVRATMKSKETKERAAPVNVEELQQTAQDGGPPPTVRRSTSQVSELAKRKNSTRRSLKQDAPPATNFVMPTSPTVQETPVEQRAPLSPTAPPTLPLRRGSSRLRHSSSTFMPITEEHISQPAKPSIVEERIESQQTISGHSSVVALDTTLPQSPPLAASRSPIPGVVSYASPQTLIGQREMFLRSKSQGNLLSNVPEPTVANQGLGSDAGSLYNYPMYAAALSVADPDDVPLSQRKEIIRQNSLISLSRSPSQSTMGRARPLPGMDSSENLAFNSHQPKRASTLPPLAAREAQLANFRQSVQHDLRSGTPIMNTGRETPFGPSTLLGGGREAEIQHNIEMQRNVLMGQKEAEAQRREMQKRDKDYVDRAFDERMRNGDMLEAHREAMRKMQKAAK